MAWTKTVFSREVLFKEVWADPLGDVAERYGVGSTELVKICEGLQVPRPTQGHWARVKAGRTDPTPELPRLPEGVSATHEIREHVEDPLPPEYAARLLTTPPPNPERPPLTVATELPRRLHPVAEQLRKRLGAAEKDREGYLVSRGEELIAMKVTAATRKRALLVIDALLREFEEYGATSTLALAPSVARPYNFDTGRALRVIVTLDDNKYELVAREPLRFVENPDRAWRELRPRVQVTTGELQVRAEGSELNWEIRDSKAGLVETRLDGLFARLPDARLRAANARVQPPQLREHVAGHRGEALEDGQRQQGLRGGPGRAGVERLQGQQQRHVVEAQGPRLGGHEDAGIGPRVARARAAARGEQRTREERDERGESLLRTADHGAEHRPTPARRRQLAVARSVVRTCRARRRRGAVGGGE